MTTNETDKTANAEPSAHEKGRAFIDEYFSRSPEEMADGYEGGHQIPYPSQEVLRVLKGELAAELAAKIAELDSQAAMLAEDPSKGRLFRAVARAKMDIGFVLIANITEENADQIGFGGIRQHAEGEFGSVVISVRRSDSMRRLAQMSYNGSMDI